MGSVTTKVGIDLEVRMGKAESEIKRLRTELDHAKISAKQTSESLTKAGASADTFNKQLAHARRSLAGAMGFTAGLVGATMAIDRMADRTLRLTGETDGLAGSWKQMAGEWTKAGDRLLVAIDRLPKALQTIEKELGGVDQAVDEQGESVGIMSSIWDDYLRKLSPLSGEHSFLAGAINSVADAVDNLALKTAKPGISKSMDTLIGKVREQEARGLTNTMLRQNEEMKTSISMLEANARTNEIVTRSLERQTKARRANVDAHKAEREAFGRELGQVEMGRASSNLSTAMDRDQFNAQLGPAQMADAGKNAKKAQLDFEKAQAEERARLLEDQATQQQALADATKRQEEEKRAAIEATMKAQFQVADVTQQVMTGTLGLAGMAAEGFIKGEKRRENAMKASAGGQAIVIGILESVKAAAAFAGFNYVEGAAHTAAAALAYGQGGILLAQAGAGGGGRSPKGGLTGDAFGPGVDPGGSVESSSGGSSRPSSNGPISEREESVQRSGRGATSRSPSGASNGPTYNITMQHIGQLDQGTVIKLRQAFKASERKAGNVTS